MSTHISIFDIYFGFENVKPLLSELKVEKWILTFIGMERLDESVPTSLHQIPFPLL